jgi:hypothetical protein
MNALIFTYEGGNDYSPYSRIVAISNDTDKLIDKMNESVEKEKEDGYEVVTSYDDIVTMMGEDETFINYKIEYDIEMI